MGPTTKKCGTASHAHNIGYRFWGDEMPRLTASVATALFLTASVGAAQEHLLEAKASFIFNGERIKISRDVTNPARFVDAFASGQAACGAPCIAPMQVAPGVETLGETEVLDFLVTQVANNVALMVDARAPHHRAKGFSPGTVSLPHSTLEASNSFRDDILRALGAREFEGVYNFADARKLLVYDNGPSSNDAGLLVGHLLDAGYPPEMISYYRGGMQVWAVLGFSIEEGAS